MLSSEMLKLSQKKFAIREIFALAKKRAEEIGENNVFDFSIGNPNIPTPVEVSNAIDYANNKLPKISVHGYSNASGEESVKTAMINHINNRFNMNYTNDDIFMTCGAAAAITISLKALVNPLEEVILLAPYYPEYFSFVQCSGGISVVVEPKDDLQLSIKNIEQSINEKTKAIIINSPNNPSGVIYHEESLKELAELLKRKSEEYNHPIYIVSDEPYREVVYQEAKVPYIPKIYENSIICYSFSKSLSIPGHRIGYILMPYGVLEEKEIRLTIPSAARIIGHVQAPMLAQLIAKFCVDITADMSQYKKNRNMLYNNLVDFGFECIKPQGAFYLLVKSPDEDVDRFIENAIKHNIFFANGSDFGCEGYIRISYCVDNEKLARSLPHFIKLTKEYNLS